MTVIAVLLTSLIEKQMIIIKYIFYSVLFLSSLFAALADNALYSGKSPYDAARSGDLDTLRQFRFEGIDLFVPDERGFIPYELAALHADLDKPDKLRRHVEVMLWLKEYEAKKHRFGKASVALVQSGLNALGYRVGTPDGIIGVKTTDAIRSFQRHNELATTGKLGPQWLGLFYLDILKDLQFKLTKLGFDTKGTDGLMGKNTRQAILNYRKKNQLSNPDYPHLDALLVNHVDRAYNQQVKRQKEAIAKKVQVAKENRIRFAQAGLRTLGHRIGKIDGMLGSKSTNAIKKFQKKYKLSVSGELSDQTYTKMQTIFLKETQRKLNYLGYQTGKPDGKMGDKTLKAMMSFRKHHKLQGNGLTASLIASVDDQFDLKTDKVAAQKRAKKPVKKRKVSSKKVTQKTQKVTSNVKKTSVSRTIPVKKKRPSNDVVKNTKTRKVEKTTAIRGNRARGRMSFKRKDGRVVGCSIAGRGIPIEWCEPFYPLPKNNHCEATFKPSSGSVVNLWCK